MKSEDICPGGKFDGATMDKEGYLWWAMFSAGKVLRIDPKTGKLEREIPIDMLCPTSVAFGGPDLRTLLVTSCGGGDVPGLEVLDMRSPANGGIALITFDDPKIQGVPFAICTDF